MRIHLNRYQLKRTLNEYTVYYNNKRAHQGIEQRIPGRFEDGIQLNQVRPVRTVKSQPILVLGGLHHQDQLPLTKRIETNNESLIDFVPSKSDLGFFDRENNKVVERA